MNECHVFPSCLRPQVRARHLARLVYKLEVEKAELQRRGGYRHGKKTSESFKYLHMESSFGQDLIPAQRGRTGNGPPDKRPYSAGSSGSNQCPDSRANCIDDTMRTKMQDPCNPAQTCGSHVDFCVMQSMLRQKEEELRILQEDSIAKGRELMNSLQLLQSAQARELELRCAGSSLAQQLELMEEALQQSDRALEKVQTELEEMEERHRHPQSCEQGESEIQSLTTELASARALADEYASRAARLESALIDSEQRSCELEEKSARLQAFINELHGPNSRALDGRGGAAVVSLIVRTILFGRLLSHVVQFLP